MYPFCERKTTRSTATKTLSIKIVNWILMVLFFFFWRLPLAWDDNIHFTYKNIIDILCKAHIWSVTHSCVQASREYSFVCPSKFETKHIHLIQICYRIGRLALTQMLNAHSFYRECVWPASMQRQLGNILLRRLPCIDLVSYSCRGIQLLCATDKLSK